MSIEQKTLNYYSTSLDKLDQLINKFDLFEEHSIEFRDELIDKIEYLSKDSEFQKSILNIDSILSTVFTKKALKVENLDTIPEESYDFNKIFLKLSDINETISKFSDIGNSETILKDVNIANINDFKELLNNNNAIQNSTGLINTNTNLNSETIIKGGSNFILSGIPEDSNLLTFSLSISKSVNLLIKSINNVNKIKEGSINKLTTYINSLSQLDQENLTSVINSLDFLSNNLFKIGTELLKANLLFLIIDNSSAKNLGNWLNTLNNIIENDSPDLTILETLSDNLISFGSKLLFASKIYGKSTVKGAEMFTNTVNSLLSSLNNIENKDLNESIDSINTLKGLLLGFGVTLLLSGPIYAAAALISVPSIFLTMSTLGLAFRFFPNEKKTKEVSKSLIYTGIGISALAASFIIWDKSNISAEDVISSMLTLSTVGTVFGILGIFNKKIKQGAAAAAFMSLSILGFSLSLAASTAVLGSNPITMLTNAGVLALTIGAFAAVFGIIGKFTSTILLGSLSVAAMGLSLIPLAYSLGMLMEIKYDWEKLAQIGTSILGIGTIYAAAGAVSPLILAGSIAFAGVGLSLIALESGISKFIGLKSDDLSFFTSFENGASGFSNLILSLSKGAEQAASFAALSGAVSIGAIGLSLNSLASGIEPFIGNDNLFKKAIDQNLGGTIGLFIDQLTTPFIALSKGKSDPSGSLTGLIFGADLGLTDAMQGARSVSAIGSSLLDISKGIEPFVGNNNVISKAISPENNLGNNIGLFISSLTEPFIGVLGGQDVTSDSLTGLIFGADFSMSKVEKGAQGVAAMGNSLLSISKGIEPFIGNDNPILKAISPENNLGNNISTFISSLTEPFLALSEGASSNSLTGLIFGADFSINKAEEGANSVKSMGDALIAISSGIKPFTGSDNPMLKAINSGLGDTIAKFITTISQPFIEVMDGEKGKSSLLSKLIGTDFSMSKALEGAETVSTMGESLLIISKGANEINNLISKINLDEYSKNVNTLITAVPNAYNNIQLPKDIENGKKKIEFFDNSINLIQKNIKSISKLSKVSDTYKNIAESFSSISESTSSISESINKMEIENVKEYSQLLYNAKEFIVKAESSSIDNAIEVLGDQLTNTIGTISSFFSSDDDDSNKSTNSNQVSQNKSINKSDLIKIVNLLIKEISDGNVNINNSLKTLTNRLNSTLTVREVN